MVYIANFDTEVKGRVFKNVGNQVDQTEYTAIGYGDNPGNPYLIGMYEENGQIRLRTVLLKDVNFVK